MTKELQNLGKAVIKLLEKKGWCKGDYEDKRGRHCLVGAIHEIGDKKSCNLSNEFRYHLKNVVADMGYDSLVDFNDAKKTDRRKVIRLIKKVISGKA